MESEMFVDSKDNRYVVKRNGETVSFNNIAIVFAIYKHFTFHNL